LPPLSMAAGYAVSDEELAQLQELSNKWEPEAVVSSARLIFTL
jgi:hypothetical protein